MVCVVFNRLGIFIKKREELQQSINNDKPHEKRRC